MLLIGLGRRSELPLQLGDLLHRAGEARFGAVMTTSRQRVSDERDVPGGLTSMLMFISVVYTG